MPASLSCWKGASVITAIAITIIEITAIEPLAPVQSANALCTRRSPLFVIVEEYGTQVRRSVPRDSTVRTALLTFSP